MASIEAPTITTIAADQCDAVCPLSSEAGWNQNAADRPMVPADLPAIIASDCALSGMERPALLKHLASRQPNAAWVAETDGRPKGFVLGREGRSASSIGPVVADDQTIGLALIA